MAGKTSGYFYTNSDSYDSSSAQLIMYWQKSDTQVGDGTTTLKWQLYTRVTSKTYASSFRRFILYNNSTGKGTKIIFKTAGAIVRVNKELNNYSGDYFEYSSDVNIPFFRNGYTEFVASNKRYKDSLLGGSGDAFGLAMHSNQSANVMCIYCVDEATSVGSWDTDASGPYSYASMQMASGVSASKIDSIDTLEGGMKWQVNDGTVILPRGTTSFKVNIEGWVGFSNYNSTSGYYMSPNGGANLKILQSGVEIDEEDEFEPEPGYIPDARFELTSSTEEMYDGATKQPGRLEKYVTVNGDLSAVEYGTYTITATPIDGYAWEDGTTESRTFKWSISKRPITIPSISPTKYTYNGSDRTPGTSNLETTYVKETKPSGKAVGTYTVTWSLKNTKSTYWDPNVNDTANKTTTWEIVKATDNATITLASGKTYDGKAFELVTAFTTTSGTGQIGYSLSSSSEPTSWVGTKADLTATKAGEYYIWYRSNGNDNYADITATYKGVVEISKAELYKPTNAGNTTFYYTGSQQSLTIKWRAPGSSEETDYKTNDYIIGKNFKHTDIGNYIASFSIKDTANYTWIGGSIEDVTFAWTITEKQIRYNLNKPAANRKCLWRGYSDNGKTRTPTTTDRDFTKVLVPSTTNLLPTENDIVYVPECQGRIFLGFDFDRDAKEPRYKVSDGLPKTVTIGSKDIPDLQDQEPLILYAIWRKNIWVLSDGDGWKLSESINVIM